MVKQNTLRALKYFSCLREAPKKLLVAGSLKKNCLRGFSNQYLKKMHLLDQIHINHLIKSHKIYQGNKSTRYLVQTL